MSKSVFDIAWREGLPTLKSVIESFSLQARKSLGQNFIVDPNITDRIARLLGDVAGTRLIEIGPGPGGLTRSLLSTNADQVVSIEFDARAIAALDHLKQAQGARFILHHGDALKTDWPDFLSAHPRNIIVANLPYNISTTLLAGWLRVLYAQKGIGNLAGMILMFQKEVADRLVAPTGSADYGRLSVLTQWLTKPSIDIVLPPGAFVPPPKIYSAVVRFIPHELKADEVGFDVVERLLTQAFAHRRKMLRSNLKEHVSDLERQGIAPTDRAQDVSVDSWIGLARQLPEKSI